MSLANFQNVIRDSGDIDFASYYAASEGKTHVHSAGAFVDDLVEAFRMESGRVGGDPTPWAKVGDDLKFRPQEVTVWFGYKGHAKSAVLSEVFCNFMLAGRKCLVISPEFPVREVLKRKVRQCAATFSPDPDRYVPAWCKWADERLYLFDKQSKLSPELVLGVVAYGIQELGVNHIVVDSLMKCGVKGHSDSLYSAQADFMDRLQHLAHGSEDTHLHIVMHGRKPSHGGDDNPPTIHDVKGASELIDLAENAISVWMDKGKWKKREAGMATDNTIPDVLLTVEAQRNHPKLGRYGLHFAPGLRFVEQANGYAAPYWQEGK